MIKRLLLISFIFFILLPAVYSQPSDTTPFELVSKDSEKEVWLDTSLVIMENDFISFTYMAHNYINNDWYIVEGYISEKDLTWAYSSILHRNRDGNFYEKEKSKADRIEFEKIQSSGVIFDIYVQILKNWKRKNIVK